VPNINNCNYQYSDTYGFQFLEKRKQLKAITLEELKMKISSRTKKILKILLENDDYIVVEKIADQVGVSSRTILRELPKVQKWLNKNNYSLDKKKGTGILLECGKEEKANIKNLLNIENVENYYTPEERKIIILSELLKSQQPTKLFNFTMLTNVSEATISHDLDEIEGWVKEYKLKLVRKPGLGVFIKGEESDIRRASINLLYENLDLQELFNLIQNKFSEDNSEMTRESLSRSRLLNLIGLDTIHILDSFIKEMEENLEYKMADDSYIALMVHLAIALKRIKKGEKISIKPEILDELKKNKEYIIASGLVTSIANAFSVEIPEAEIGYVTMHLKGSKGRGGIYGDEVSITEDYRLVFLTRKIIEKAEIELGIYLEDDEQLLVGLVRHLEPTIHRIKLDLDIRNPLLEEIKENYADLFEVSKKCAQILAEEENIEVPESEAAYLAMHLGSAVERKRKPVTKYRAAVACTSGIGASRLLASRLSSEFDNLEIVGLISTIDFDNKRLENMNVDLIISTVDIPDSNLPVIVVNPLLNKKHQRQIKDFILSHKAKKKHKSNKISLKEKLEIINNYNQRILEVLNNFEIYNNYKYENINKLISFASEKLAAHNSDIKEIENDLKRREELGSTILEHKNIMLLHCKSTFVQELKFMIIRPDTNFEILNKNNKKIKINIVVVMAVPMHRSEQGREVLSEISRLLIESKDFIESVNTGDKNEIYFELAEYFDQFLQEKSTMEYHKEEN
jgi:mannitol operon transcriptional antiterminator